MEIIHLPQGCHPPYPIAAHRAGQDSTESARTSGASSDLASMSPLPWDKLEDALWLKIRKVRPSQRFLGSVNVLFSPGWGTPRC